MEEESLRFSQHTNLALPNPCKFQELDPLPDVPDAGRFLVERLQQAAAQAPQLAPTINQLAQTYQLS